MSQPAKKTLQYLGEAHATELGQVRVLQSQIAMTPRGGYRTALEQHLRQTRGHAERLQTRMRELGQGGNPVQAGIGVAETLLAQALALGKTPLDLLRGSGGEEKVLKNAKDACATEALEIATYTAIERLATTVGDEETARLAASIRADEEAMLARVLKEIPGLTEDVVGADVHGNGSYDIATTGAGEAVKGAARTTREPWAGYDELSVADIRAALAAKDADDELAAATRDYERAHKNRAGVLALVDGELSKA